MSVALFHRSKNKKVKVCFNGACSEEGGEDKVFGLIFDRRLS